MYSDFRYLSILKLYTVETEVKKKTAEKKLIKSTL